MPLPLTQPSNCQDRVLQYLEAIALAMGGVSAYQPQASEGDPNGILTARWARDFAIDVISHRLYYAAAADSQVWAMAPVPAPGAPVLPPNFAAIANASFELPDLGASAYLYSVAGWTVEYPTGGVQKFGPATGLTVPDGNQVFFLAGYADQLLGDLLVAGNYVLKIWVMSRLDFPSYGYRVKLIAGTSEIISHEGVLTAGTAQELTLSAVVPSGHPHLYFGLKIVLESMGQTSFDHVRLWTP